MASPEDSTLQILSWNVAGWKTTSEHLRRFGGLSSFVQGHHADVLCIQEVKLTSKQLAAEGKQLSADLDGYESFWACNEGSGAQRQGLNGVATFARRGLVVRADSAPLECPELDAEGRCLLTDHGSWVLFNVYVPNSHMASRLSFKLRWLRALRVAMQRERAKGKAVVLAGDLNLKHRPEDSHWSFLPFRPGCLQQLLAVERPEGGLDPEARQQLTVAAKSWDAVAAAFRAKEHRPIETRNYRSGQTFQKWAVFAPLPDGQSGASEMVKLGSPMDSEDDARRAFLLDGIGVEEDGEVLVGPASMDAAHMLRAPGEISLGEMAEGFKKIVSVELSVRALRWLATKAVAPNCPSSVRSWLTAVLQEDSMVDTFAELYPRAQDRFTCWDQYRNKRFENEGSRIDYIIVDKPFFQQHVVRGAGLDGWGHPDPDSPAAARTAATLGGLSQPTPFAGGGMQALQEDEYLTHLRAKSKGQSSGIIYTPPQLSDHVAVSLLLRGCHADPVAGGQRDAATQRCQPHRAARRITDFFASRKAAAPSEPPAKRRALGAG